MKMRLALTTAVVVAIALLAVANGQSTDCFTSILGHCTDPYSTRGLESCCNIVTKLYRTDLSCLCLISSNATQSNDDLVTLLQHCDESISVVGTYVCSSGSYYNSPTYEVNTAAESFKVDILSKLKSTGTLVGIIVGAVAFLVLFILLVCALLPRRINLPPPAQPALTAYPQPLHVAPQPVELVQGYAQQIVVVATQPREPGYNLTPPKNESKGMPQGPVETTTIIGPSCTIFSYEDLRKASNGFSGQNLLGRGDFGVVYSGTLNGRQVAIKQLMDESSMEIEDFKMEIETITHVHHKNVVSLVGYCCTKDKMLLVFELVPNGTLESHLHKGERRGYTMDWFTRMKVALGSAKGLAYLHEDCHLQIVHCDIKAASILLDCEFVPKVAGFGFGLAKKAHSHTVRIVGTSGYIDPEYHYGEQPTAKSDVYSFGVVLLELITGRKPIENNKNLVDWARPLLSQALMDENCDAIVDERLGNNYNREEMLRVIYCSAACIRRSAHRPSMSRVVRILEGLVTIKELKQDLQQPNQSFSSSSASFSYESSHQSNAGTGNFNG